MKKNTIHRALIVLCALVAAIAAYNVFANEDPLIAPALVEVATEQNGPIFQVGDLVDVALEERESGRQVSDTTAVEGLVFIKQGPSIALRPGSSGSISLNRGGVVEEISFVDGKCSLDTGSDFRIISMREEGVALSVEQCLVQQSTSSVQVVGYGYPGVFVSATDDGAPLGQIEIFSTGEDPPKSIPTKPAHPGNTTVWTKVAESETGVAYAPMPKALPANAFGIQLWATSPGFSWEKLELASMAEGNSRTFTLQKAGELKVSMPQFREHDQLRMFVSNAQDGKLYAEYSPIFRGYFELKGMHPGKYEAFLSLDSLYADAFEASPRVSFEIAPNQSASIEMNLLPDQAPVGQLQVQVATESAVLWADSSKLKKLGISIVPKEESMSFAVLPRGKKYAEFVGSSNDPGEEHARNWFWDVGQLPVGVYSVLVDQVGFKVDVTVNEGELSTALVDIPTIGRTLVELKVGKGIGPGVSVFEPKTDEKQKSMRSIAANKEGLFELSTLPGPIEIVTYHPMHGMRSTPFEVQPGWNYATVHFDLK